MLTDGRIVLKATPSLALSVGTPDSNGIRSVIIDTADPNDLNQQWLSLGNSQYVWNGFASNAVLASVDSDAVGVRSKSDESPGQLWYIYGPSFICASSAKALTVTGGIGSELNLQPWVPGDSNQQFTYINKEIVHDATGLILVMQGDLDDGKIILADPSTDSKESRWSIFPGSPPEDVTSNEIKLVTLPWTEKISRVSQRDTRETATWSTNVLGDFRCGLTAAGLTSYIVSITTADVMLAGTDNIVKISLENKFMGESLPSVELNNSITHQDPFERGHRDVFVLSDMKDIGQITGVTFQISKQHWYSMWDDWYVTGITVVNAKWHTNSQWTVQQMGNLAYLKVPDKISLPMLLAPGAKYDCTMILGKAPAQDRIGKTFGWDHTWIEVINKAGGSTRTFFDCAGGHRGPGTELVDMGICDRNDVVRMSTGYDIDDSHPLKETYGSNRTDGFENANLRCDGKLNWDGQCHQIANRYLWTCIPSTSIDDIPYEKQPHGYGLSVSIFGKYGINFSKWCLDEGFGYVETDDYQQFMYWWQKLGFIKDKGGEVYRLILQLRDALFKSSDPKPDGAEVKKFVGDLKKTAGMSVNDIAKMTNLTEKEVKELLGETGGWFG